MEDEKYISTLNNNDNKYACKVLHEDPETLYQKINDFRGWLKVQDKLNAKTGE